MKTKKRYIYIIFFACLFVIITYLIGNFSRGESVKVNIEIKSGKLKELTTALNEDNYIIQSKHESDEYSDITVYYPVTKYSKVNSKITDYIVSTISEFKKQIDPKLVNELKSKMFLDINFNVYTYLDYVSYVIHTNIFTGGAHPNTYVKTISYNKKNNNIISLNDLIKMNKNLLYELSEYSYNQLVKNNVIIDIGAYDMLKEGTKPIENNFKNFAFTSEGLLIFFEKYQVAPYVAGEFSVTVPYENINLKI